MNTTTLRFIHRIAAVAGYLAASTLLAENFNVTVQSVDLTKDIQLRIDGIVVAKGVKNTPLVSGDQGAAVRMLWHPGKAAFRAGEVYGTGSAFWDEIYIGLYSFAQGYNPRATGISSIALGDTASAGNSNDIAIGYHTTAYSGTAIGNQALAYYNGYSFGTNANTSSNGIALGYSAAASSSSAALGTYVNASTYSSAIGYQNTANNYSTALGNFTIATGKYATSMGYSTTAQAYGSTVIGQFNTQQGSTSTWIGTDPLFVIGNGTPPTVQGGQPIRSDSLTVYKNGNATFQGVVRVAPGGDIPMFSGN